MTHLKYIVDIFMRKLNDAVAAGRQQLQHAFSHEVDERIAHGAAAHSQLIGHFADAKLRARLDFHLVDALEQMLVDLLPKISTLRYKARLWHGVARSVYAIYHIVYTVYAIIYRPADFVKRIA